MSQIFNLKQDYVFFLQQIEELEGELTPELEEFLKCTEENAVDHAEQLTNIWKQLEVDIDAIKVEIDRLKQLSDKKKVAIDKLKASLLWIINNFGEANKAGVKSIKTSTLSISTRKSKACIIEEDEFNHPDYKNYTVKTVFDEEEKEGLEKDFNISPSDFTPKFNKELLKEVLIKSITETQYLNISDEGYIVCADFVNSEYLTEEFIKDNQHLTYNGSMYKYNAETNVYTRIAYIQENLNVNKK